METFKSARWMEVLLLAVLVCVMMLAVLDGRETGALSREEQMERMLSSIEGAGRVRVMLADGGAVVLAEGRQDFSVVLALQRSVQTLTGLPVGRIEVIMSEG